MGKESRRRKEKQQELATTATTQIDVLKVLQGCMTDEKVVLSIFDSAYENGVLGVHEFALRAVQTYRHDFPHMLPYLTAQVPDKDLVQLAIDVWPDFLESMDNKILEHGTPGVLPCAMYDKIKMFGDRCIPAFFNSIATKEKAERARLAREEKCAKEAMCQNASNGDHEKPGPPTPPPWSCDDEKVEDLQRRKRAAQARADKAAKAEEEDKALSRANRRPKKITSRSRGKEEATRLDPRASAKREADKAASIEEAKKHSVGLARLDEKRVDKLLCDLDARRTAREIGGS